MTIKPSSNFNTPYQPHRPTQSSGIMIQDAPYPKPTIHNTYSSDTWLKNKSRQNMPQTPHPTLIPQTCTT